MKHLSLLLASALVAVPSTVHAEQITIFKSEYDTSFYLEKIGAGYAYDNGWTGKDVTIGVIDDGVDPGKPEFGGRISTSSRDFGSIYYTDESGNQKSRLRNDIVDDLSTHGPLVVSVLAGNAQGWGSMGVAPQAKVAMFRIDDYYVDSKQKSLAVWPQIYALDYAVNQRIKIVNRSYSMFSPVVEFTKAMDTFAKSGSLLINSSGNYAGESPMDSHSVTTFNRRAWLFVGAVEEKNGEIVPTSYTNLAGSMTDRFIMAFGNVRVGLIDGSLNVTERDIKGTSFSTPMVAGAAALILEKWPELTGQEVGDILLVSARDLGEPGVDEIYGHGLLDVEAALRPISPRLSNGTTSIQMTYTSVGSAVGISEIRANVSDLVILDRYNRDYTADISKSVSNEDGRRRLRDLASPSKVGNFTIGYDSTVGEFIDNPTVFGYKNIMIYPGGGVGIKTKHFSFSLLKDDSVFGVKSNGPLSIGKSSTSFLFTTEESFDIRDDLSIDSRIDLGVTIVDETRDSIIRDVSPLVSTKWHIDLVNETNWGKASIGIGQDLTIESGSAIVHKAVAYDGSLKFKDVKTSLKSESRNVVMRADVEYSDLLSLSVRQNVSGDKDTTVFVKFNQHF